MTLEIRIIIRHSICLRRRGIISYYTQATNFAEIKNSAKWVLFFLGGGIENFLKENAFGNVDIKPI